MKTQSKKTEKQQNEVPDVDRLKLTEVEELRLRVRVLTIENAQLKKEILNLKLSRINLEVQYKTAVLNAEEKDAEKELDGTFKNILTSRSIDPDGYSINLNEGTIVEKGE